MQIDSQMQTELVGFIFKFKNYSQNSHRETRQPWDIHRGPGGALEAIYTFLNRNVQMKQVQGISREKQYGKIAVEVI